MNLSAMRFLNPDMPTSIHLERELNLNRHNNIPDLNDVNETSDR